jgi:hypothetical protein
MDITNPSLNASLSDSSRNDDSFTQSGTTVNIGAGATYNQNCGNGKELTRRRSMWTTIIVSLACDAVLACMLFYLHDRNADKVVQVERNVAAEMARSVRESAQMHEKMMRQAKEGTIWLLRDDIIKSIDYFDATRRITQKQYKRIKDEYEYYVSIGGNHDVKERFEEFFSSIYGTGEIKMVAEPVPEQ